MRDLPGFGKKTEENILKSIEAYKKSAGRFLLTFVEREAAKLIEYIHNFEAAQEGTSQKLIRSITPAGSLRRHKETIGDLDLLLTLTPRARTSPRNSTRSRSTSSTIGPIEQALAQGENKVSVRLVNDLQVDVRLLAPANYGAALIYFTGSKEHNVALRSRALKMGLTLNEYVLATLPAPPAEPDGRTLPVTTGRGVAGATEEEVYAALKLDFIPPELRENTGEIDAAAQLPPSAPHRANRPRGDLQMHTTASDGRHSIEAMAEAARALRLRIHRHHGSQQSFQHRQRA